VAYKTGRLQIHRHVEGTSLKYFATGFISSKNENICTLIWVKISVFLFICDLGKYEGLALLVSWVG
jgi:hypothetical protein